MTVAELEATERAPEAFRPPPGNPRFEHFDSMRALAALAVLLTHAAAQAQVQTASYAPLVQRLNVGVTVFFLISGFLLYRPWVASRAGAPRRSITSYARSRLLRIVPAYWVALTILAVWPGLPGLFSADTPFYYGFAQIYQPDTFLGGLAPAWTLCVEMSFYLALPFWAMAADRLAAQRGFRSATRVEAVVLMVAALLALGWHTAVQYQTDRDYLAQSIFGLFDWFALGMGLALLSVNQHVSPTRAGTILQSRPGLWWISAAGLYVAVCFGVGLPAYPMFPPPAMTIAQIVFENVGYGLIALLLLIPAAFPGNRSGWTRALLSWPPLAWLGVISYGIFLWHDPLVYELDDLGALRLIPGMPVVSMTLATVAVAVPLGAASWYLVERPALRFKRRGTSRRAQA